ncbi:MAG: carbohydrate kinase family protein [Fervidobacterium nodosum]
MTVTCIGKLNVDLFYPVKEIKVNENHVSEEIYINVGGKATNVSVALAKLGVNSTLITKVGEDEFGDFALKKLKEFGVNVIADRIERTGITFIIVDEKANNTMFNYLGANKFLCSDDVLRNEEIISKSDIVYFQSGIEPEVLNNLKKTNKNIFVELSEFIDLSLLNGISYASMNESEALRISNTTNVEDAADKLISLGIEKLFIKLGSKGSFYYSKKEKIFCESFKINPIDTTGAGDSFTAGIIYGLLNRMPVKKILKFANACGAITCLKKGTTESFPTLQQINSFLGPSL